MEMISRSPCTRQRRRRPHANIPKGDQSLTNTTRLEVGITNGPSPCGARDQPHQVNDDITTIPPHVDLPEDAWRLIYYSLMSMRDAARAACVSRRFLRFWRCHPNRTFNQETVAANRRSSDDKGKYLLSVARQVLEHHSGVGVKTLKLNLSTCRDEDIDANLLNEWLQAFVKRGLCELALSLPDSCAKDYTFPYSLLSSDEPGNGSEVSIQSLHLASCGFHPVEAGPSRPQLGCSRSLSKLCLRKVGVTNEELGVFLSSCLALASLDLCNCDVITSLKVPRVLRKLRTVRVQTCRALRVVESRAPKLASFHYDGWPLSTFSLGDSLETEELDLHVSRMADVIQYAGSVLPSVAVNLETLVLSTVHEKLKAPVMLLDKFQKLKHLTICLGAGGGFGTGYDFLSLACFLDACPSLETFILRIEDGFAWYKKYVIVGKPDEESTSPQPHHEVPELRHGGLGNLRTATITGFCSAKSLVELTSHILDRAAPSLQRLTLDASPGYDRKRCSADRCRPMLVDALQDAERALAAVRAHVVPNVPAGVELRVLGPCPGCHAMDAKAVEEAQARVPRSFWQRQADGSVALVIVQPRS